MNALVRAFDKLHMVLPENSRFRLKVESVDVGQKAPGSFQLAINAGGIEDQLGAWESVICVCLRDSTWRYIGSKFR